MIATLVHIWVKQPYIADFIRATIENHTNTIQEKGNLRFDFLQDEGNPSKFTLYEVFESDHAIGEHKTTSHYLKWRDAVSDWMDQPRQGVRHTVLSPSDISQW